MSGCECWTLEKVVSENENARCEVSECLICHKPIFECLGHASPMPVPMSGTTPASDDKEWVCTVCRKKSRTQYGFDSTGKSVASEGWDESCMLNAVLVDKVESSQHP